MLQYCTVSVHKFSKYHSVNMLCLQKKTAWFLLFREVITVDCGAGINKMYKYIVWVEYSLSTFNPYPANVENSVSS
jgi:hypothetical protein